MLLTHESYAFFKNNTLNNIRQKLGAHPEVDVLASEVSMVFESAFTKDCPPSKLDENNFDAFFSVHKNFCNESLSLLIKSYPSPEVKQLLEENDRKYLCQASERSLESGRLEFRIS